MLWKTVGKLRRNRLHKKRISLLNKYFRDLKSSAKFMTQFKMQAAKLGGPNPFAQRNRYHLLKKELARLIPSDNCVCHFCLNGLWCP